MNIGDLVFRLLVDDKGLEAQVSKSGTKAGKQFGSSFGSQMSQAKKGLFQGLGIGAGLGVAGAVTAAVGAVTDVIGDSIAAFQEEEKSVASLKAALEANIPAFDGNTAAIERVLSARMDLGFADDEQRASLARLVSQTRDANKALDLQRTAMDLARLRGIDLASATELIGKVYGGNVGILRRYGIMLAKGTTATEAIAEIQRRATGQAEAFANTTAGKSVRAQIKLNEAMEKFGAVAAPIAADAMMVVADTIEVAMDILGELGDVLEPVTDLLGGLGDVVGNVAPIVQGFFTGLGDAIDSVAGPVSDLLGGIGDFGAGVIDALDGAGLAAERFSDVAETALDAGYQAFRAGERNTTAAVQAGITGPFETEIDTMDEDAEEAARKAVEAIATELSNGADNVNRAIIKLREAAEDPMDDLSRIAALEGILAGQELADGLADADPYVRQAAAELKAEVISEINAIKGAAKTGGKNVGIAFAAGIDSSSNAIRDAARRAAAAARPYFRGFSPPKVGPLKDIDKWGVNIGRTFADSLVEGMSTLQTDLASMVPSGTSRMATAASPQTAVVAPAPSTGDTNYNVSVEGLIEARDPFEIATQMRRFGEVGLLTTPAARGIPTRA